MCKIWIRPLSGHFWPHPVSLVTFTCEWGTTGVKLLAHRISPLPIRVMNIVWSHMITLVWQLVCFFRQMIWFDLIPNQHQTWSKRENGLNFEVLALIAGKWRAAVKAPLITVPRWCVDRIPCDLWILTVLTGDVRWQVEAWLGKHARQAGQRLKSAQSKPAEAQSIQQWMQRISG